MNKTKAQTMRAREEEYKRLGEFRDASGQAHFPDAKLDGSTMDPSVQKKGR